MVRTILALSEQSVYRLSQLFLLWMLVLTPVTASAGQIYGQITHNGRSVAAGVPVTVVCPQSPSATARTDRFGSYQVYVRGTGRCEITVTFGGAGLKSGIVSYTNPVRYNFDVVGGGRNMRLIRR